MKKILLATMMFFSFPSQISARDSVKMAFVGDILLAGQAGSITLQKNDFSYPFAESAHILRTADIAFGNLECVFSGDKVLRNVKGGGFVFKTPPRMAQALSWAGIDIVSLANNHALDGGVKGVTDTIATLEKFDIRYVGGGRNWAEARSLRIIEIKEKKVGFLAFADLCNHQDCGASTQKAGIAMLKAETARALTAVKTARKKTDILIVSVHWGVEYMPSPSERQRKLARDFIDAGADIIIGHHPHVLQPIEFYKDRIIAYSLGNFVFDNPRLPQRKTMILQIEEKGGKFSYETVSCLITNAQPDCR